MTTERYTECFNKYYTANNGVYLTRVSRKQVGVIFSNWKRGAITAPKSFVSYLYNHVADVSGFINNTHDEELHSAVKMTIEAIFGGDMDFAQDCINSAIKNIVCHWESKEIETIKAEMN